MIRHFLRERTGLIMLFYLSTATTLTLVGLLLSFQGVGAQQLWANLGYAFLLCTTFLGIYLGIVYAQWYPFASQVRALVDQEVDLEALANLPPGAGPEQMAFRELMVKLYRLSVAERLRYQETHQRHLAFMNLWVHQMKTPVSAISLIAQQEAIKEPSHHMAGVLEETGKLSDGLDLVLNMARLQDFALDYKIDRVDLLGSVRTVINSRKKQFIRLSIFPEVQANEEPWTILTDEKWNGFIIDQIVSNALKYGSQTGRPDQRLTFRLERGSKRVTLVITDQGPGIPPQDLDRVFQPFFTGENGRRYADATGIGLYMVGQVADRLGHQVAIASVEGEGTTVTLTYAV